MKKKKYPLLIGVLITFCLMSVFNVFAHSGRTDANGGHWDRSTGEYHYHTGEYAGRNQSSSNSNSNSKNTKLEQIFKKYGVTGKYREKTEPLVRAVKGAVREMDSSVPLPPESAEESVMPVLLVPFLVVICLNFLFVKIFRKRNDSMQNSAENAQEGKKSIPGTRLSELREKYGIIPSGENPHRDVHAPRTIKNKLCSAVAVVVLFSSIGIALHNLLVHYGKGTAAAFLLLWFWAFNYAFQKDSKSKRISELECENEVLKNILENYKKADEQLHTKVSENAKNIPLKPCIIPDDVVFDDRNLPVRKSRSRKKKVNYGKDFNAFLVKGGTIYHKKSCKKLKGKKVTTKHIYECIADKNKRACPFCKPRTEIHEWYKAKFPDSPYAKATNYNKEEQLSLFDDVEMIATE